MMKAHMLRGGRSVLAVGALILALAGCDCPDCPKCPECPAVATKPSKEELDSIHPADEPLGQKQKDFFAKMLPKPRVTKCQLEKVEKAFDDHVFHNAAGTSKVLRPSYVFSISSFRSFIRYAQTCTNSSKIILIRHGLDALGRITYGLAITCASEADQSFPQPTIHYMPNTELDLEPWTGAEGETWKGIFGDRYTVEGNSASIYVKQTSIPILAFDLDDDTYFVTHEVDRIFAFLNQNTTPPAGQTRTATHVEIVSYAHEKAGGRTHHGVVLVALDSAGRMINNTTYDSAEFYMKGVDLGSPCPDNCAIFMSVSSGMSVDRCVD